MLGTVAFTVLFGLVFLNIYLPYSEISWFRFGDAVYFLFIVAFISLAVGILAMSRVLMYRAKNWFRMTYLYYTLWCITELFLLCFSYTIVTIFIIGPSSVAPFHLFSKTLLYGTPAIGIPYVLAGMYLLVADRNKAIRRAKARVVVTDKTSAQHVYTEKITLYDNNGALKLSVDLDDLYYIESDDNYIRVWYGDSTGALKMYMLRCSLKSVEDRYSATSLMRCNRKYIVNADKVKVLSKEDDGYFLDLGKDEIAPITVTKTYQADILSRFSAI